MESNASRISPGPKNRPHRPPRPQGNPPPINGVAIPPRHQLPHLPYITDSLFSKFSSCKVQSFKVARFQRLKVSNALVIPRSVSLTPERENRASRCARYDPKAARESQPVQRKDS